MSSVSKITMTPKDIKIEDCLQTINLSYINLIINFLSFKLNGSGKKSEGYLVTFARAQKKLVFFKIWFSFK